MEKKVSTSHERKVDAYLKPANFSYIQKYVEINGGSASAAVDAAVKLARTTLPLPPAPKK